MKYDREVNSGFLFLYPNFHGHVTQSTDLTEKKKIIFKIPFANDNQITASGQLQKLHKFRSASHDRVLINDLCLREHQSGCQYDPPKEPIAHQGRRQQCHQEYMVQHTHRTLLMVITFPKSPLIFN